MKCFLSRRIERATRIEKTSRFGRGSQYFDHVARHYQHGRRFLVREIHIDCRLTIAHDRRTDSSGSRLRFSEHHIKRYSLAPQKLCSWIRNETGNYDVVTRVVAYLDDDPRILQNLDAGAQLGSNFI